MSVFSVNFLQNFAWYLELYTTDARHISNGTVVYYILQATKKKDTQFNSACLRFSSICFLKTHTHMHNVTMCYLFSWNIKIPTRSTRCHYNDCHYQISLQRFPGLLPHSHFRPQSLHVRFLFIKIMLACC